MPYGYRRLIELPPSAGAPAIFYLFPLEAPLIKELSVFVDESDAALERLATICSHSSTTAASSKIKQD